MPEPVTAATAAISFAALMLAGAIMVARHLRGRTLPVDVRLVHCEAFGGGWAFAETGAGRDALTAFYGAPEPLYPFGGELGYVVEPHEAEALVEHFAGEGATWGVR